MIHDLIEALSENIADEAWKERLGNWRNENCRLHLAIFVEPFLGWVLDGTKAVESRFSINKCAPYGKVKSGDILLVKKSGGPIVALARAGIVWSYVLNPDSWKEIKEDFAKGICAQDPSFWESRKSACYATLIKLEDVVPVNSIPFQKKDRRGWVVLSDPLQIQIENLV